MGKHTPYTSEPSHPHTSASTPGRQHVDVESYGSGGRKTGHSSKHHTSKGYLGWGKAKETKNKSSSGK